MNKLKYESSFFLLHSEKIVIMKIKGLTTTTTIIKCFLFILKLNSFFISLIFRFRDEF